MDCVITTGELDLLMTETGVQFSQQPESYIDSIISDTEYNVTSHAGGAAVGVHREI